jgi:hypothetical protein
MLKAPRVLLPAAAWLTALTGGWWLPDGVTIVVTGVAIAATLTEAIRATDARDKAMLIAVALANRPLPAADHRGLRAVR